jgi:hypothetical protein
LSLLTVWGSQADGPEQGDVGLLGSAWADDGSPASKDATDTLFAGLTDGKAPQA